MSALGNAQAQAGRYLQTERGLRCFAKTISDIMIWATLADQRRTLRRQLGHLAVIMAEPGAPQHYCLVIDTSDGGVRVSTSHDFEVPDQFILRLFGRRDHLQSGLAQRPAGRRQACQSRIPTASATGV
jgi:hypothetical protein